MPRSDLSPPSRIGSGAQEIARAVEAFALTEREVRDILIYGFKRSFFPGTYLEKRAYVRAVIDYADKVLQGSLLADPLASTQELRRVRLSRRARPVAAARGPFGRRPASATRRPCS